MLVTEVVRTATGPTSEAATARGSAVLRHEHGRESVVSALFVDCGWCIGHACLSRWSQAHAAPRVSRDVSEHTFGIEISRAMWNTSHPPAMRASCGRIRRIEKDVTMDEWRLQRGVVRARSERLC
jgi:hypothetical protein